jgi:hypothetical protein
LHPLLLLAGSPLFDRPEEFGLVYEEKAPHYVLESKYWTREDMSVASKWTNKIFVYFNPAVNMTVIMLSELLEQEPFDLFKRLYEFITKKIDPTLIFSDIGIMRENALFLNDLLEKFIRTELRDPRFRPYLDPLIDAMAFVGCKTMFYTPEMAARISSSWGGATGNGKSGIVPVLSRDVVLKRFSCDMARLYTDNVLKSPDELLRFEPKTYDVLFNLRSHSIYHVSEHVSDLLASSSGGHTLEELVQSLAEKKNLLVDEDAYLSIQETFNDLARKRVLELIEYQAATGEYTAGVRHVSFASN